MLMTYAIIAVLQYMILFNIRDDASQVEPMNKNEEEAIF